MPIRNSKYVAYKYPDPDDSLTISLINKHEPFPGHWGKSEKFVLKHVKNLFRKKFLGENSTLLDAGCGDGRLLFEFEKYFNKIVAIEPDRERLKRAKETINQTGYSEKVKFINTEIETFSHENQFDAIVCSHVIQHVDTGHISILFNKLKDLLTPSGYLILLTCHSGLSKDFFVKDFFDGNSIHEVKIEKDEFNTLIQNQNDILPIHFFTIDTIKKIYENVNLDIKKILTFHFLTKNYYFDWLLPRDIFYNTIPCLKKRYGRDMLIISQRNNY